MSKLINLFIDLDKLDGPKNYKSWKRHMQNKLIYNELWNDICDGDTQPTNPIDVSLLAKWELKDEKALALIRSSAIEHLFVHIDSSTSAWFAWNQFHKIFYTPPASQ
jgi:hypothetical protein